MKKNVSVAILSTMLLFASIGALSAQSSPLYYIAVGSQQYGPYDMRTIGQIAQNGQINETTPMWTSGMLNWAPAYSIPALRALFVAARQPYASQPVFITPVQSAAPAQTVTPVQESPGTAFAYSPSVPVLTVPQYYIADAGKKMGPFSYAQLQKMLSIGQINENTFLWTEGMDTWRDIGNIPELQPLFGRSSTITSETIVARPVVKNSTDDFTLGRRIASAAMNPLLGLGSYTMGDWGGGLIITAGYGAAIGLILWDIFGIDYDSNLAGVPGTIGIGVAAATTVFGIIRPLVYHRTGSESKVPATLQRANFGIIPGESGIEAVRLGYNFKF
jgi:hypothetical protein